MAVHLHLPHRTSPNRLKLTASALLALPIAVLLLFAIGEMTSGEISGSQHLLQAAPLLVLLATGWRFPRMAGIALFAAGALLLVIWLVFVLAEGGPSPRGWEILMWAGAGLVLFVPPLLAGWLFFQAGRGR